MPGSDLRFLVVEDHELERKVLIHLLRQMGAVEVHGAGDGRAALQVMHDAGRPVDIVVTDPCPAWPGEASLSTDTAKAFENFARLRVDGFGVALATSFVAGTGTDTSTRVGLALGLQTGDKLKLRTVADRIASEGDWNLLHDWGCDLGQGPYVCGPLAADAVPAWVAQRSGAVSP